MDPWNQHRHSKALNHDEKGWYFENKEFRNCNEKNYCHLCMVLCCRLFFLGYIEMTMFIVNVYVNRLFIYLVTKQ